MAAEQRTEKEDEMNPDTLIQPHPDAPEGSVLSLASYRASDFRPGQAVLCRLVAPLVSHAYGLLMRDVPCLILGRDIGKALCDIVKKQRAVGLDHLIERLGQWAERETALALQDRNDSLAERISDQHSCLLLFIDSLDEDSRTVNDLLAKIELMFTDDSTKAQGRVTLASVHKAKGLEFNTVYLLDKHLIPSKFARQPWQLVQERNLLYVAITRAMSTLVYINSNSWTE